MTFEQLLKLLCDDRTIAVRTDSRAVKPGDVFVAVTGTAVDGHDFIESALSKGAAHVVVNADHLASDGKYIVADDTAIAAAQLAQASRGNPAARLTNLAVTGTNGKTTVAFLVRAALNNAGLRCGLMGTVVYDTGAGLYEASLTTPDSLEIAARQAEMVAAGMKHMVIEASSHALSQSRLAGIDFTAAAFTNLTGDHLDYHLTEESYLAAKARLFTGLSPEATAILNTQSAHAKKIAPQTRANVVYYAVNEQADLTARIETMDVSGTVFALEYAGRTSTVRTPLIGMYNISNHLAAAGLCLAAGLDLRSAAEGLSSLQAVPGRLEKVETDRGFSVLIDYAHTDDALKNVLATLKPLSKGRLVALFGCGGDRDKTKRPRMAAVAEQFADRVIVTSDNPRTEDPDAIIKDIIAGFESPASPAITVEPDRQRAIDMAIADARDDDVILIAGKGHEDYQIIGSDKRHFSDKEAAMGALSSRR